MEYSCNNSRDIDIVSTLFSPYKEQAFFWLALFSPQMAELPGPVVGDVMAVKQWEIYFISSEPLLSKMSSQGRPEKKTVKKYHSHTEVIMEEKESL